MVYLNVAWQHLHITKVCEMLKKKLSIFLWMVRVHVYCSSLLCRCKWYAGFCRSGSGSPAHREIFLKDTWICSRYHVHKQCHSKKKMIVNGTKLKTCPTQCCYTCRTMAILKSESPALHIHFSIFSRIPQKFPHNFSFMYFFEKFWKIKNNRRDSEKWWKTY